MTKMLLLIEDMFKIKDRGYVATGEVAAGPICTGDRVWVPVGNVSLRFVIAEIQTISKRLEEAHTGEHIGVLLSGEGGELLQRGHVLCQDNYPADAPSQ